MKKFFYLQMEGGSKAPLLLSATGVVGTNRESSTETRIFYKSENTGDEVRLLHADDASSPLKMEAFLVDELQKLLSTPATNVAPLLIPPVEIATYSLG
tara:strand:+ start:531 stop:824 length:294 start_codon:yes stop_codon:yes gene_type:complete